MEQVEESVDKVQGFIQSGMLQAAIVAVVILVVTAILSYAIVRLIKRLLSSDGVPLPSSTILVNIARIVIWTTGVSVMLSLCFGVDVNGIIAALGVGGIALSLGLQDTIKNFIGGLQVTIMGIVHPGDHIVVGGTEGIVHDVSWRQTTVVDYEHVVHLIPNSVINSTEVQKITPEFLVSSVVVLNIDGRNIDELMREMEAIAKSAVEKVAPLEKDPWLLVTQIGEYGVWAKMRFVLADVEYAREARDAALRAIAPYTRNNSSQILPDDED